MSDTTQRATRAEIDAQRAIAAKAWEEGARSRQKWPTPLESDTLRRDAERWAAEEFPYPAVTRPRVVTDGDGVEYKIDCDGVLWFGGRANGRKWMISSARGLAKVQALASLLTKAQLDEVRHGPCGPTETVEAE